MEPVVSDQAVLRYLERVKGINIDGVRKEMLSPNVRQGIAIGAHAVKLGCGARLMIKGNTITTVLT